MLENLKRAVGNLVDNYKAAMNFYGEALLRGQGLNCA